MALLGGGGSMIEYKGVLNDRAIDVSQLHSIYYFRYAPGQPLDRECHDFWEMVYIDEAEVEIISGNEVYLLHQGEIFFHEPNEFHQIKINRTKSANSLIVSFSTDSPAIACLKKQRMFVDREHRVLLTNLINEAHMVYGLLLDCHRDLTEDIRQERFGAIQMMISYLEIFLISMVRLCTQQLTRAARPSLPSGTNLSPDEMVQALKGYMESHLGGDLCFEDCRSYLNVSATSLKKLFLAQNEPSVMRLYQQLRIEEARRLLRSGKYNITQVAMALGYKSVQHFSTQFKRFIGVSPSAYLRRVQP